MEHLVCSQSALRCSLSVEYTLDFKDLVQRNVKNALIFLHWLHAEIRYIRLSKILLISSLFSLLVFVRLLEIFELCMWLSYFYCPKLPPKLMVVWFEAEHSSLALVRMSKSSGARNLKTVSIKMNYFLFQLIFTQWDGRHDLTGACGHCDVVRPWASGFLNFIVWTRKYFKRNARVFASRNCILGMYTNMS